MDPASLSLTILKEWKSSLFLLLKSVLTPVAKKENNHGQIRRELTTKFNGLSGVENVLTLMKEVLNIFDVGNDQLYEDSALLPLPGDLQMRYENIKKHMSGIGLDVANFANSDETTFDADFAVLMKWLATKDPTEQTPNIVQFLIKESSLEEFQQWTFEICRLLVQFYSFKLSYVHHKYLDTEGPLYWQEYRNKTSQKEVLSNIRSCLTEMHVNTKRVTDIFQEAGQHIKTSFLTRKCPDKHHEKCGAGSDSHCSELTGKIYVQLHATALAPVSNQTMAKKIASILQDSYPHFRWSVIVLDDKDLVKQQHHVKMRVQTFGTSTIENRHLPSTVLRESCVALPGPGNYGQFLCYKEEPHSSKAALVLWADPGAAFSPDMVRQCFQLREKWVKKWINSKPQQENDVTLKEALPFVEDLLNTVNNTSGNRAETWLKTINCLKAKGAANNAKDLLVENTISYVEDWMETINMDAAFTISINGETDNEDIGFSWFPSAEDRSEVGPKTPDFPIVLDNPGAGGNKPLFLVWPKSGQSNSTLRCPVEERTAMAAVLSTAPSHLTGKMYRRVVRGRRDRDGTYENVVIKNIQIPAANRQHRIEAVELLSGFFRKLVDNGSWNVAVFYGCQVNLSVFQIVMEPCFGGCLSERVRTRVTLRDIRCWAREIADGLNHLHETLKIVHNDLQPDHIMFAGPEFGEGCLKIISIGRLEDILGTTAARKSPIRGIFQPREACTVPAQTGRKTDIYSLGAIMIQMIRGETPVVIGDRAGLDFYLEIPSNIPDRLRDLIRGCLQKDHDMRPSMEKVIEELDKCNSEWSSEFENEGWICPVRSA